MSDNLAYQHDGSGDTRDYMVASVPTPTEMLLSRQRANAAATRARYALARKNGYRGIVTRADLAAQCERNQRDNAS